MNRVFGWLFVILLNAIILAGAGLYTLHRTDNFIEDKRKQTLIYDIHSLRRQVIVPGQTYHRGKTTIKINSWGTRGKAPTTPKPKDTFRLVAMGGSSVFDHHLGEGSSWPEKLQNNLKVNNGNVDSYNAGIPGFSSRETLSFYLDKWRYAQPDVVILYQGWNDVKYMSLFEEKVDADRFYSVKSWRDKYKFLTAPKFVRNLYAIPVMYEEWKRDSKRLQENKAPKAAPKKKAPKQVAAQPKKQVQKIEKKIPAAKDWSKSAGMEYFRKNVETFVQMVKSDGATPVLVTQNTLVTPQLEKKNFRKVAFKFVNQDLPNLIAVNDSMADVLRETAKKHNVPYVDLRQELNGNIKYFIDHVHLAGTGSDTFSNLLSQALAEEFDELELKSDKEI